MGIVTKLLGGVWGYVAAAALSAVVAAYIVAQPYRVTIANMKAEKAEGVAKSATDALAQLTNDADTIHSAAQAYGEFQLDLNAKFATLSKDFKHAIGAKPLPSDCRPDPDRMRSLYTAIEATNTAVGYRPIPAVPDAH